MARREFANLPTTPRETGTVVVKTPGGALADISLTVDGDAIDGSVLTVEADGIIPEFYGPPDGADVLVVTMKSHGVDWDSDVRASDAAPSSGVSLPPTDVESAGFLLAVTAEGDGYELADPAVLPSPGGPVIRCKLDFGSLSYPEARIPYYGRLNDTGDDYLGFKHTMTFVGVAAADDVLAVTLSTLGSTLTDLTAGEILALGSEGGLSTDGTMVLIHRLDTPGFVRLVQPAAAALPSNSGLTFDAKSGETGTSGVTLTDGIATLAAGTYAVTVVYSIDVFWG